MDRQMQYSRVPVQQQHHRFISWIIEGTIRKRDIITNTICHKQFEQIEVCAHYYVHDNVHVWLSIYN